MTGFLDRPKGTLENAIAGRDFDAVADWARYLDECNHIHMGSLLSVCRVVEEIGYVLSGTRYEETESVWNVAARIARERGAGALVDEVQAGYEAEIREAESSVTYMADLPEGAGRG
ncbi:hypothetical protein QRB41_27345 [Mycobacterium avium subsp. hominissuis]|uniref:hypothetical protein n=1 Tax=Mycobacterium avium TaxID=1764 RepID=UPI00049F3E0D|nr:hypothetical protein [Mycobacterium avium]KDP00241.1 hypothetical protein MAV100_25525 [Mycobacterium avium subsp. hominissuis 100]MDO2387033.1 hypothetical protein [Mycobacterium avium subsp. hominissuis]